MQPRRLSSRLRVAVGAACLAVLAGFGFQSATGLSAARYESARQGLYRDQTQLTEIQARLRDLRGAQKADLSLPADVLWGSDGDGGASLRFQRELLQAAEASGLAVASYSSAVGPSGLQNPSVGLQLEATTDYPSLTAFLEALQAMRPRISISSLWIGHLPPRADRPTEALVSLRLVAWGFSGEGGDIP